MLASGGFASSAAGTVRIRTSTTGRGAELAEGRRHGVHLPDLTKISWMSVCHLRNRSLLPLVTKLGIGEMEVLALGLEAPNRLLVLDDRYARRYACAAGLEITGTLGILVLAKERGIIGAIRPVLERLQELEFRLDAKTREKVLGMAEELH